MKNDYKMLIEAFGYSISHIIKEDDLSLKFYKSLDDAFHQSFNLAKISEDNKTLQIFDQDNVLLETLRLP
ncbi:hypothetical protein BD780_000606 [Clostridium tetanomorphum]|uniref:Uncharacterized protein n=1 Tax=Clostridium tetanomorphum TaxID=1553 RepID=A0A923E6Y4_CLOTT|nr:hypothetical protein [Clostridium tetanomorphum]KAJ51786.1 hypothetical protein CTM_10978 [Clostridium tetanomorphum DSM 665]MBC2397667.1 hypothetical protein [Clostridium tetanomorphum]MBP1865021.1 hypothetical protein [Clostridium tetanomorphum]NRS83381.1 hypothetical protein [Clostridium tetanomorphum]NRZ96581.1 hypothetical protein [Clostridium tetanomorphum]